MLVHGIAFARKEDLEGEFVATPREGFQLALDVSAYSLLNVTNRMLPLLEKNGASIVTLSYLAAERAVPSYNVMGSAKAVLEQSVRQLAYELGPKNIRVNAISAGPVSTLAARGIHGFTDMLKKHAEKAPLKRNITKDEVGKAGLFLLSDLASGITGEVPTWTPATASWAGEVRQRPHVPTLISARVGALRPRPAGAGTDSLAFRGSAGIVGSPSSVR